MFMLIDLSIFSNLVGLDGLVVYLLVSDSDESIDCDVNWIFLILGEISSVEPVSKLLTCTGEVGDIEWF